MNRKLLIITLIILLFILPCIIYILYIEYEDYVIYDPENGYYERYDERYFDRIVIERSEYYSNGNYLSLTSFPIDNSSIQNITDFTINLEIIVVGNDKDLNVTYRWIEFDLDWGERAIKVQNQDDKIEIFEFDKYEEYFFTIRFIVDSKDPEISNLNLMGTNNTIKGTFSFDYRWNLIVTFEEEIENYINIIDNEKFEIPLGQVITIKRIQEYEVYD